MKIAGRVVIVTGGASGIGSALAQRFQRDGAKTVVVADRDGEGAKAAAETFGAVHAQCDVADETQIGNLVEETERQWGPVDLFCSNAGVAFFDPIPSDAMSAPN